MAVSKGVGCFAEKRELRTLSFLPSSLVETTLFSAAIGGPLYDIFVSIATGFNRQQGIFVKQQTARIYSCHLALRGFPPATKLRFLVRYRAAAIAGREGCAEFSDAQRRRTPL
jgi:hypothetical protein